jgi:hypothetical protein
MEIIIYVLVGITVIIMISLFAALRRALNVNDTLEENVRVLEEENTALLNSNSTYDAWFDEFKLRIVVAYQRIKAIDASGHFEADDEVGFFFKELKSLIERLHELGIMDEIEKQETEEGAPKITTEELKKVLSQRNVAAHIEKKE